MLLGIKDKIYLQKLVALLPKHPNKTMNNEKRERQRAMLSLMLNANARHCNLVLLLSNAEKLVFFVHPLSLLTYTNRGQCLIWHFMVSFTHCTSSSSSSFVVKTFSLCFLLYLLFIIILFLSGLFSRIRPIAINFFYQCEYYSPPPILPI